MCVCVCTHTSVWDVHVRVHVVCVCMSTFSLFGAMASSSSMKMIAGAFFSASSKAVHSKAATGRGTNMKQSQQYIANRDTTSVIQPKDTHNLPTPERHSQWAHTVTHACMQTFTYAHMHAHITHTHTRARARTRMHICTHTHTHTVTNVRTLRRMQAEDSLHAWCITACHVLYLQVIPSSPMDVMAGWGKIMERQPPTYPSPTSTHTLAPFLRLLSDSPAILLMISGPLMRKKKAPVSLATARAIRVFPVPGGPYKRMPRGGWGEGGMRVRPSPFTAG